MEMPNAAEKSQPNCDISTSKSLQSQLENKFKQFCSSVELDPFSPPPPWYMSNVFCILNFEVSDLSFG